MRCNGKKQPETQGPAGPGPEETQEKPGTPENEGSRVW